MSACYLNAKELVKYFNGPTGDLPQKGGPKDYDSDGSWLQGKRIQHFIQERHDVLSEERVKKKSHLVKGEWKPDIKKVEIINIVGKFWMTCGHVIDGRCLLYPEEALSLLDKADIEIYYGNLPMSLQEAYPTLLGDRVPLEHYQVYNHLSRVGYIVFRHQPITKVTKYERAIGLDKKVDGEGRSQRKKKRKAARAEEEKAKIAKMDHHQEPCNQIVNKTKISSEESLTETDRTESSNHCSSTGASISEEDICDKNSICDRVKTIAEKSDIEISDMFFDSRPWACQFGYASQPRATLPYSDFSNIIFPSLSCNSTPVPFNPDPIFLPEGISFTGNEKSQISANTSARLTFGTRTMKAKNWSEFKREMSATPEADFLKNSPVGHLWSGEVTPLIKPSEAVSTASMLDRMKIIQNRNFVDDSDSYPTPLRNTEIVYDVYQPNADFRKTVPGIPAFRLAIVRQDEPMPGLAEMVSVAKSSCDGAPLQWAVVDNGDLSFYTFLGVDLPCDITVP